MSKPKVIKICHIKKEVHVSSITLANMATIQSKGYKVIIVNPSISGKKINFRS